MGFFIGVALAVGIGVYFGMSFYKDSHATWDLLKQRSSKIGGILIKVLGVVFCLAVLGGIIYGCYYLIKITDWDVVGAIAIIIAFIFIYIYGLGRLYKITHKKKNSK